MSLLTIRFAKKGLLVLAALCLCVGMLMSGCSSAKEKSTASTKDVEAVAVEKVAGSDEKEEADKGALASDTSSEAPSEEAPGANPESEVASEPEAEAGPQEEMVDGMRASFKEATDGYEAFFDEYVQFMTEYSNSDDTTAMLADYLSFMEQYNEAMEKMSAMGEEEMNDAEMLYYIDVQTRVNNKLLGAAADM